VRRRNYFYWKNKFPKLGKPGVPKKLKNPKVVARLGAWSIRHLPSKM
jgi:hypothetical protein